MQRVPPERGGHAHTSNTRPAKSSTEDELGAVAEAPALASLHSDLPILISVSLAARLLGIPRSSAYRLAATGELPIRRVGGRIYVITAKFFEMWEAA